MLSLLANYTNPGLESSFHKFKSRWDEGFRMVDVLLHVPSQFWLPHNLRCKNHTKGVLHRLADPGEKTMKRHKLSALAYSVYQKAFKMVVSLIAMTYDNRSYKGTPGKFLQLPGPWFLSSGFPEPFENHPTLTSWYCPLHRLPNLRMRTFTISC